LFDLFKHLIAGGGVNTTVHFEPMYKQYAIEETTSGRPPVPFPDWLKLQGYYQDENGLVYPNKDGMRPNTMATSTPSQ